MRLNDIASQHIVSDKAGFGIWPCDCSQRRLKDTKVTLQSLIYCDYIVLAAQKCEKLQWGPTRYVSFPTAVNIFTCSRLKTKIWHNFYSPQIQMADQTAFVTTSPFPFWRNKTKLLTTKHFAVTTSILAPAEFIFQPVVYTVLPTTKEILEWDHGPLLSCSPQRTEKNIGDIFPVMLLAVFVVITRLKTSHQLKEGYVSEEAIF